MQIATFCWKRLRVNVKKSNDGNLKIATDRIILPAIACITSCLAVIGHPQYTVVNRVHHDRDNGRDFARCHEPLSSSNAYWVRLISIT